MDVIGHLFQVFVTAITSTWALAIAIIGIFIGVGSWLFGNHDHKGNSAKMIIASVVLLGLQQFVAWIHP
jgi:hypothetical protein